MDKLFTQLFPLLITGLMLLLPFLFMGLAIFLYVRARRKAAERARLMQIAAGQFGWAFAPTASFSMFQGLEQFQLFSQGHSKEILNMLYADVDGMRAAIFDYAYVVGHGKNRHRSYQTVAYYQSGKLSLPFFTLRPESTLHKIFGAFGYQDIDFGNRPEFSGRYLLRGQDENGIRRAFTDAVLSFYESNPRLSTEGGGNQLFFYQEGVSVPPENVSQFWQWGRGALNLFQNPW
jgi:hypothetical protein